MSSGIVVVDKPSGWTSHDVVGRIRRLGSTRKVGHAGTLDPMATGVLVVGVNRATRLLGHLTLSDKAYTATIRLGQSTHTDDADGEPTGGSPAQDVSAAQVERARDTFLGEIEQVPSTVSAVKVAGRRAYERARAGEEVRLKARRVRVSRFDLTDFRADGEVMDVDVCIVCSSGTYVRALARDLGRLLDVGGHLVALRRTRVGPFDVHSARTLAQLADELTLMSLADVAGTVFPLVELDSGRAEAVRHGAVLDGFTLGAPGPVALYDPDGEFLALYSQRGPDARAVAVFAGSE